MAKKNALERKTAKKWKTCRAHEFTPTPQKDEH